MTNKEYRERLGQQLRQRREERGDTLYKVAKTGEIFLQNAKAVEEGISNYTIDTLLGYLRGSNLTLSVEQA